MNPSASPSSRSAGFPPDRAPVRTRSAWRLWLYGLGMLIPALGFAHRYPLRGNSDRLVDIGKLAQYGVTEFAGYVAGLTLMFALYILALRESRRLTTPRALPAIFACGTALAVAMGWMYPVNAIDLFIYAVRSRLLTTYGVNPLTARPVNFADDPLMRFASQEWGTHVSPYGPLWNLVAAPVTALAGDRLGPALAGFKLLAIVALLLGGWLIVRTLAVIDPDAAATGALFYLWNPLVLWEGIGNGHNDIVMVVPLLAALLAWARRRDGWVIPLLIVATLIKYVTMLLLPLAAIALWRRTDTWAERGRVALASVGFSLLAIAVAFFPFYDLGAVLESIAAQGDIFLTSPAAMAIGLLRTDYPVIEIKQWARAIGYSLLLAVLVWQMLVLWRRPERLPRAAFETLFVFLLVATWNFRVWYLIWPVALAALIPWGWPAWRTIAWTAGGLAGYALFIWGWEWWGADFYAVQNVAVPLMTGPALLLTLLAIGRATGRTPSAGARAEPRTAPPAAAPAER